MSLKYKQVTIGAAATQFFTTHTPCRMAIISNGRNANVANVGDKTVTSTTGIKLAAANAVNAVVTLGNTSGAPSINLDDVWVVGTQNDLIDVIYLP
jgi:putative Ca2+/H+ antiporter (TMEM165/GDT1 family)